MQNNNNTCFSAPPFRLQNEPRYEANFLQDEVLPRDKNDKKK